MSLRQYARAGCTVGIPLLGFYRASDGVRLVGYTCYPLLL
jgi:hypothetical protein